LINLPALKVQTLLTTLANISTAYHSRHSNITTTPLELP